MFLDVVLAENSGKGLIWKICTPRVRFLSLFSGKMWKISEFYNTDFIFVIFMDDYVQVLSSNQIAAFQTISIQDSMNTLNILQCKTRKVKYITLLNFI